jgi:hypothetical protein
MTAVVTDDPEAPSRAGALWPVISGLLRKDPEARLTAIEAQRRLRHVAETGDTSGLDSPADPQDGQEPRMGLLESLLHDDAFARQGTTPPEAAGHPRGFRLRPALVVGSAVAVAAAAIIAISVAAINGQTGSHGRARAAAAALPGGTASASSPAPHPSGSAQASSGSGASKAIPAGYYRFTNSTGFAIGVPQGWQISHVGHYVYIRDPADASIFLLIDQSSQPQPNPLADWQQQAANRQSTYLDYHLIELRAVSYRPQAEKAADWEFTYDRDGLMVQVLNRNVLANAHHAYALYWSTPVTDWNACYHYFQTFAATFRPAS